MLIPAEHDLTAVIGGSFDVVFKLYVDDNQTELLDLTQTGYAYEEAQLQMDNVMIVSTYNGLEVDAEHGTISCHLSGAAPSNPVPATRYRLMLPYTNGSGADFPINGICRWETP
jgi:hypothetical protein